VNRPRLAGLSSIDLELADLSRSPFSLPIVGRGVTRGRHGDLAHTIDGRETPPDREGMGNRVDRVDLFFSTGVYFS
jgi:hypothetical protein